MQILLLNAYDTTSHRAWCEGLIRHMPQHQWQYLSLPGRYFSWRIRGNPLSWAYGKARKQLAQPFDLIVATSMVDLATLRGLIPSLATTPAIIYFHENQFAYPDTPQQHKSLEPQMVNLYSALSAQKVVFNSVYNQETFLNGVSELMQKLPDQIPADLSQSLQEKSSVLPVPISNDSPIDVPRQSIHKRPFKLIWNHRWEYDKGPETLAALCRLIDEKQLPIDVWILGQSFRQIPKALQQLHDVPASCVKHMGTMEKKADYKACLTKADIVLSTALHEFQGLAVLEAVQQGCTPLVPDRLAYPEWVPDICRYPNGLKEGLAEAEAICQYLVHWLDEGRPEIPQVNPYTWNHLLPKYEKLLSATYRISSSNR